MRGLASQVDGHMTLPAVSIPNVGVFIWVYLKWVPPCSARSRFLSGAAACATPSRWYQHRRATAVFVPGGPEALGTVRLIQPLTERERQVLRLLAAGLTSNEIAGELVTAVNTARSYIKSL